MGDYQVMTVDIWLEENKYAVAHKISTTSLIPASAELELIKVFRDFPYPPKTTLSELSNKFVIPLKQVLDWFSIKRLQNRISWSSSEIDYAKATIVKYHDQIKLNNEDGSSEVVSNHDSIISNISSKKSVASTTEVEGLNLVSSSENVPCKVEQMENEIQSQQKHDFSSSTLLLQNRSKKNYELFGGPNSSVYNTSGFMCGLCNDSFGNKKAYDLHLKRKHKKEKKKFFCIHCEYSSSRKDHVERHQLSHTRVKRFFCDKCGIYFGRKNSLKQHTKAIHINETQECETHQIIC